MSWERFDKLVAEFPEAKFVALPREREFGIEWQSIPQGVATTAYTVSRQCVDKPVDMS